MDRQTQQVPITPGSLGNPDIKGNFGTKPKASALFKQSFAILNGDKELILFPILSVVFSIIGAVAVLMLYIIFYITVLNRRNSPVGYIFLFLYYLVVYFISIYFNVGLTASVLKKFQDGQSPKFSYGLQQANSHLGTIFGYSMIAATIGFILNLFANNRRNIIGRIIADLFAAAWALATIFIVPVIVTTELSPVEAIKYSAKLFRSNWGNTFKGLVGFFLFSFLGILISLIPAILGFVLRSPVALVIGIGLTVLGILLVSILVSTCTAIFKTALYHYATTKQVPNGFESNIAMAIKS